MTSRISSDIRFLAVDYFCKKIVFYPQFMGNEKKPANISLLKLNNRNTEKICKISSKLTIKTPFSTIPIVDFKQVNVSWEAYLGP